MVSRGEKGKEKGVKILWFFLVPSAGFKRVDVSQELLMDWLSKSQLCLEETSGTRLAKPCHKPAEPVWRKPGELEASRTIFGENQWNQKPKEPCLVESSRTVNQQNHVWRKPVGHCLGWTSRSCLKNQIQWFSTEFSFKFISTVPFKH